MDTPGQNGHNNPRLDLLEKLMDLLITDHLTFTDEHKKLLTAQVVLTDRLERLAMSVQELRDAQKATDEQIKATDEQIKATDERMSALIVTVDHLIRNRPGI